MSNIGGGGTPCVVCAKTVYPAEAVSFEKQTYHVSCFKCSECDKKISAASASSFDSKIFCSHCFQKGGYAQKQRNVKWTKKESKSNALASKFGGGGNPCVVCSKTVYPAEQVSYEKKIYHLACFKCKTCNKKINGGANAASYNDDLYCKKCFMAGGFAQKQRNVKWNKSDSGANNVLASRFGGGGAKCTICDKTVYQAEMVSFEKKPYHQQCFKCTKCDKKMTPASANKFESELFCSKCFQEGGYNRKQATSGGGDGEEKKKTYNSRFAKFGGGGTKCVKCNKTVYDAEKIQYEGKAFHPKCFTCEKCDKKLTPSSAEYHKGNDSIHCKACFLELGLNRAGS